MIEGGKVVGYKVLEGKVGMLNKPVYKYYFVKLSYVVQVFKVFIALFFALLLITSNEVYSKTILKGGIRTVIEKGNTLKLSLNTPLNFYYSQVGDKVVGFIREDILFGENLYIPRGSSIEGIVTNIKKPKHFGIDGAFEIDLNKIVIPAGAEIPIYASVSTDKFTPEEKVASILTYDASLITYGSFHGLIAGLQYGGLPLAVASHGISLLAGAGVGAGAGVVGSVVRKGKIPKAVSGLPVKVALKSDLSIFGELPNIKELEDQKIRESEKEEYLGFRFYPSVKEEEVELVVSSIKEGNDKTYGNYVLLEFNLKNNSRKSISFSDFVLVGDFETLHPDLFLSGTKALKIVKPFDEINGSLTFLITNKIENYSLAIVDPLDKKEIVKISLKAKDQ